MRRVHARDLMEDYPAVDVSTDAGTAARMLADRGRPALLVFADGRPKTVLPASEVLGFLIPPWVRDDPSLAGVVDEQGTDAITRRLAGRSVRDLLGDRLTRLPSVGPDDTTIECAAVMLHHHSPLCVVLDDHGVLLGAITASRLIEALLP